MRLIDADALLLDWEWFDECGNYTRAGQAVADAPTIDAVEVVRCGECRHKYMKDFDMFCPHMVGIIKPNMYCSYAEKVKP